MIDMDEFGECGVYFETVPKKKPIAYLSLEVQGENGDQHKFSRYMYHNEEHRPEARQTI
jgi:hypothetical protein